MTLRQPHHRPPHPLPSQVVPPRAKVPVALRACHDPFIIVPRQSSFLGSCINFPDIVRNAGSLLPPSPPLVSLAHGSNARCGGHGPFRVRQDHPSANGDVNSPEPLTFIFAMRRRLTRPAALVCSRGDLPWSVEALDL
ncbi:hypothetical protein D9615_006301 [Tricholomella constricta]|uniref:Uncharacterized protein n=1 Tax=Tricholomella constricta TaxID=117010 RepID=A0A8H5M489_9AGAR|nr:hypothetical protein D9615_006301 [Tricholomella constricta]